MHFKLYLALAAFSVLAIQAQEVRVGVAGAIRNATEQYNTTNARLSRIILVNEQLRQRACSTVSLTKNAVTLNANAIRDAILEQLEKINALGLRFAANDACNRPQTPQALAKFKSYIDAVKADDRKTAQSFSLVEGVLDTLNCALDE
ncbi:MAG: hypothetical protein Q9185_004751 [Variospora sp. 1 TL-2023]